MRRRPRQLSLRECFNILNLEKNADLQAVKRAYRRRAFELHPDLNPNDPEANQQFQLLNEAYVALSAVLKPAEEAARKKAESHSSRAKTQNTTASATKTDDNKQFDGNGSDRGSQTGDGQNGEKTDNSGKSQAYAEQDILRELLNDPFARRVFEDIYSELSRQQTDIPHQKSSRSGDDQTHATDRGQSRSVNPTTDTHMAHGHPQEKQTLSAKKKTVPNRVKQLQISPYPTRDTNKGVAGAVKGWLRHQIDDEQTLTLPAAGLVPGRKIRLQIRKGFATELMTVEITLPPDFVIGKPIRLRGLGKKVGPWQGDLFLTILSH